MVGDGLVELLGEGVDREERGRTAAVLEARGVDVVDDALDRLRDGPEATGQLPSAAAKATWVRWLALSLLRPSQQLWNVKVRTTSLPVGQSGYLSALLPWLPTWSWKWWAPLETPGATMTLSELNRPPA